MTKTEKQQAKKFDYNSSWISLPLLLICAIVAGIFGETIMRTYIAKDIYSPYSNYNEVNLSNLTAASPGLIIRDPKKVVVNQDVKISETISSLKTSFVSVFEKIEVPFLADKKNANGDSSVENIDYSYYYDLNKPLFIGFIITSDGWAVASISDDFNFSKKDLVVIDSSRRVYEVSDLSAVNGDGLVFFRLADARNLPIRKNIAKSDFFIGQSLLAVKNLNLVNPLNLVSLSEKADLLNSENSNLNLGFSLSPLELKNNFIFDLAGDLAAIVNNQGELIPAFSYNYQWLSLMNVNDLGRPLFGVNYLNLSDIKIASSSTDMSKGALLFSDGKVPAVMKNSPAAKSGLKEHDIITWINNYEINNDNDLAEIISFYKPGDKLNLIYLRDGKELRSELILEVMATGSIHLIK